MAQETLTQLDFNFSNASGSEQTATVTTSLGAYDFSGVKVTGSFITSGGYKTALTTTNSDLNTFLSPFKVIEITENQDSLSKTKTYKLQDELSLKMQSVVLLLRGKDVGPKGELFFDDYVPNWTELEDGIRYDQTVLSYANGTTDGQTPTVLGKALILGQIYNEITLKDVKGEDYTRVYLNKIEKPDLGKAPINDVFQYAYVWGQPKEDDKGSWQDSTIRLGFTLKELRLGLDELDIAHEGIPDNEDYLIDLSGKLIDVINTAAQQIGYFWYIDLSVPATPKIKFHNSNDIDTYLPTNYIDTVDQKIISSSYTESVLKPDRALAYTADLEIKEPDFQDRTQKERKLRKPFKRLNLSNKVIAVIEFFLKNYFLLWQTDTFTEENFKKIWYYGMHSSPNFRLAVEELEYEDKCAEENIKIVLDDAVAAYKLMQSSQNRNKATAANWAIIEKYELAKYFQEPKQVKKNGDPIFNEIYSMAKEDPDTEGNKSKPKSIEDPSSLYVYGLLQLFFEAAFGGIYVSTPISEYRAERSSFQPDDKYAILGIFAFDEKLEDIPALKPLGDFLLTFTDKNTLRIDNLVKKFYPNFTTANRYFAIAFENIPDKFKKTDRSEVEVVLGDEQIRILESAEGIDYLSMANSVALDNLLKTSRDEYDAAKLAIVPDDFISIPYTRSRNPLAEESDRNDDDDNVPTSSGFTDLDQNRKLRYWDTRVPSNPNIYTPMTLQGFSGRTKNEVNSLISISKTAVGNERRISSTREIDGFELPTFGPLLSSVSISYGSSGVTTSITESNIDIIPIDQTILLDRERRVSSISSTFTKVSANKKNLLGL